MPAFKRTRVKSFTKSRKLIICHPWDSWKLFQSGFPTKNINCVFCLNLQNAGPGGGGDKTEWTHLYSSPSLASPILFSYFVCNSFSFSLCWCFFRHACFFQVLWVAASEVQYKEEMDRHRWLDRWKIKVIGFTLNTLKIFRTFRKATEECCCGHGETLRVWHRVFRWIVVTVCSRNWTSSGAGLLFLQFLLNEGETQGAPDHVWMDEMETVLSGGMGTKLSI